MGEIVADLHPTVSSQGSFTLMAFARPDGFDQGARIAVSLGGETYMPIGLGYRPEPGEGRWAAQMITGSQTSPVAEFILSEADAATTLNPEGWVHLAATYDATRSEVRFYVNGVPQATTGVWPDWQLGVLSGEKLSLTRPFAADSGELVIGRGTWDMPNGTKSGPWKGSVKGVRVTSGVMPGSEITAIAEEGLGAGDGGGDGW